MPSEPPDRHIYHITHVRNLPGILARKHLFCEAVVADGVPLIVDIGMPTIKARRRRTLVSCGPGGTPADYVPFYFGPRSPMLLSISSGRVPTYDEGQDPVVYLVTSVNAIRSAGLRAVFTDGNAGAAFVQFYDDAKNLLETVIDWPLMRARYWGDTADDPNRANRRQAEYLVHRAVPTALVSGFVTRDERRAAQVCDMLAAVGLVRPVAVRPDWYYDDPEPRRAGR